MDNKRVFVHFIATKRDGYIKGYVFFMYDKSFISSNDAIFMSKALIEITKKHDNLCEVTITSYGFYDYEYAN